MKGGCRMPVKAVVFDMDGTILHTLPDLVAAANETFARLGYPARTEAEALACMGSGGRHLVQKLMPAGCTRAEGERAFQMWRDIYIACDYAGTKPFPGIVEALHELRARGVATAVLSNKFDAGVQALAERFFDGLFDLVRGEVPPAPRKPDPTVLLDMLAELGVRPSEAAYVGDTVVDAQVARNAGVLAVGVSWGYDKTEPLPRDELDAYLCDPAELLALV
ncbi:MAG TPA: HAD family hydrolase [Eggerthellaceae bacterium]|nr:HAD family hydrolase [Eggerthellaceae bacterium]